MAFTHGNKSASRFVSLCEQCSVGGTHQRSHLCVCSQLGEPGGGHECGLLSRCGHGDRGLVLLGGGLLGRGSLLGRDRSGLLRGGQVGGVAAQVGHQLLGQATHPQNGLGVQGRPAASVRAVLVAGPDLFPEPLGLAELLEGQVLVRQGGVGGQQQGLLAGHAVQQQQQAAVSPGQVLQEVPQQRHLRATQEAAEPDRVLAQLLRALRLGLVQLLQLLLGVGRAQAGPQQPLVLLPALLPHLQELGEALEAGGLVLGRQVLVGLAQVPQTHGGQGRARRGGVLGLGGGLVLVGRLWGRAATQQVLAALHLPPQALPGPLAVPVAAQQAVPAVCQPELQGVWQG
mmetsp:Transcript_31912/g.43569  ORF Transcript_31912/g.43569 Transcript_31912/m.43569 type:complete len:343 (-) Transcript_31912:4330-5358(-)